MVKTKLALLALLATSFACNKKRHVIQRGPNHKRTITPRAPLTSDEQLIISSFDNTSISEYSYYYTHRVHIAGQNVDEAQWTADRFAEAGFASSLAYYNVFLNYPVSQSITLTTGNSTTELELQEDCLPVDETTCSPDRIPIFHGYSASGDAAAQYVYVGRGQMDDYQALVDLGVELEGKIALSMYGGPFRGLKVKNAQDYGMIGAVIFTDPVDDGDITVANGYKAYPDGPARNPTSVQRGSVEFLSTYSGDPTTPGYPSIGDPERTDGSEVLPSIPSIPISYQNAQSILAALNGTGFSAKEVNREDWVGALEADYSSGPAPGVEISMSNQMRDFFGPIADAIGVINGTDPTQTLLVGNHRDAWILGGAADPNSGTAVLVEMAYVLGDLIEQGWQPRTNIVLCSWDAEEYGLVGSTEWMEEYLPWLSESAVTYLNIDVAVDGTVPYVDATPDLHELAISTMKKINWPVGGGTMYDAWNEGHDGEIGILGSGSDFTPFLSVVGTSALDTGADLGPKDPIYHYHSDYDSYYWMETFGDPGFLLHKAMGQFFTLMTYQLASDTILPLDPVNYATQMDIYYEELQGVIQDANANLSTTALKSAISTFQSAAEQAESEASKAEQSGDSAAIEAVNEKYMLYQRGFVDTPGLPNREFFKHSIFAPGLDTGYAPVTFPGITEAITIYDDLAMAREWVTITADSILAAAKVLSA